MPFQPGYKAFVMLDGVNGTGTNISQYCDTVAWGQDTDMQDVSVFGTAAKAFIPGQTDGNVVAIGGPMDPALMTILYAIKAATAAGSSTSTLVVGPAGSVATYTKASAETWISNINFDASVGSRGSWTASLQITGAVTNTVW